MDKEEVKQECERITQIAHKYESCYEEIYQQKCEEVVREAYATGGELIHRGYLCPSLIKDIVVGKVKRGRIVKKKPSANKEYCIYGFDKDDNLITAQRDDDKEFIIREDGVEMGIVFSEHWGIKEISECRYKNGKLLSYGHYLYEPFEKYVNDFQKEEYTYGEKTMKVDYYQCTNHKHILITYYEYNFTLEDGYLTTYTVTEHRVEDDIAKMVPRDMLERSEELKKRFGTYEPHFHKVDKKRKIT